MSVGDPEAENLLVEGDNLEALKALLPRYRGQVKCIYKMGKMASDPEELHKKAVGELWASRSDGRCQFGWSVNKDWSRLIEVLDG